MKFSGEPLEVITLAASAGVTLTPQPWGGIVVDVPGHLAAERADHLLGLVAAWKPEIHQLLSEGRNDDRRTCRQCRALLPSGACLVERGRYYPDPDLKRRCANYRPTPDDTDQRQGLERWPSLANPYTLKP